MPGTRLTEDAIKDVYEAIMEEIKENIPKQEYEKIYTLVHKAAYKVFLKYRGKPYNKARLCRYSGDNNPPLREVPHKTGEHNE